MHSWALSSAWVLVLLVLQAASIALGGQSDESAQDGCDDDTRRGIPALDYHPVVVLPLGLAEVLDLTRPFQEQERRLWSIGKYDEDRVIYDQPLFGGTRTVHVGIDLGGPAHAAVHAFWGGEVVENGVNPAAGDYGPTLVTEHRLGNNGTVVYALFGHLSTASLALSPKGRRFARGDVLGWLGTKEENGGWPPHVHFQISKERPKTHDMPGAVSKEDRAAALERYPDPQLILGKLY